jgi:CBS domain-containing protein
VVTAPADTLLTRMTLQTYNVRLPVVDNDGLSGSSMSPTSCWRLFVTPSDSAPKRVMSTRSTPCRRKPIGRLLDIFEREHVPIVVDGTFVGLITRIDIPHYLRRKLT